MEHSKKAAVFLLLGFLVGLADAADFSGAYQDPASPLNVVLIIQKGDTAVLTSNGLIPDNAPAGQSNVVGWGVGIVNGSQIDIPEYHDNYGYCINHHVWTVSADGSTLSKAILSSTVTARGTAANFDCAQNVGQTATRVKIW